MSTSFNSMDGSYFRALQRPVSIADRSVLEQGAFRRMLSLESKRAERSGKPFLLCLFEIESPLALETTRHTLGNILSVLDSHTRETDVTGWYRDEAVVGVMFTEIAIEARSSILATIMTRVNRTLRGHLTPREFTQLGIAFHVFPEEKTVERILPSSTAAVQPLYAEILVSDEARRLG